MKTIKAFGYTWEVRSEQATPDRVNYNENNVAFSRVTDSDWSLDKPTERSILQDRVSFDLKKVVGQSAGIRLSESLGFGTYTWVIGGALHAIDPNTNVACWLHPDKLAGVGLETNFEFCSWKDPGKEDPVHAGAILRGGAQTSAQAPAMANTVSVIATSNKDVAMRKFNVTKCILTIEKDAQYFHILGWNESQNRWHQMLFKESHHPGTADVIAKMSFYLWDSVDFYYSKVADQGATRVTLNHFSFKK